MKQKTAVVTGAGGFIGSHLVTRLKSEGYYVIGIDLKYPEFKETDADVFHIYDLTIQSGINKLFIDPFKHGKLNEIGVDEVYTLAADMGGAGFVFTGEHDADIMYNSAMINLNVINTCIQLGIKKLFYSSSACIYPAYNQTDPDNPNCSEDSAYPAAPDSEYGFEKLFSERMFLSFQKNYGVDVRIARFHNIFGINGTWNGGREKFPAAICRKVLMCPDNGEIEIWGTGKQTRSFLYIDECIEGIRRLMENDSFYGPVNIGSEEMISVNDLAKEVIKLSGKNITIKNIPGPVGVNGRVSCNKLIEEKLNWKPTSKLYDGMVKTYSWIKHQIDNEKNK